MAETLTQLLHMSWSAWRRRGYALLVAWLVCAVGWVGVAGIPDTYESTATVYVDTANILKPLLAGLAVETDVTAEIRLMEQTLVNRPNLEKVARAVDLDLNSRTPSQKEKLISSLRSRMTIRREGPDLFQITYLDHDPRLARDIVQALLNIFIENNLGRNRSDMETAREFIENQIRAYERQLEAAERRLARFKQDNMQILPGQGDGGYPRQLEMATTQLSVAESELRSAALRQATLKREIQSIPQFLPARVGIGGVPLTETEIKIANLERTLEDLLSRYTDGHPDVIVARRQLGELEKLRRQERETAAGRGGNAAAGATERGPSNPVYEQVRVRLVQEATNIATLTNQVIEAKKRLARIRSFAERVPGTEAELAKLNRDYGVLKAKYTELLSSRESERISRARELQGENVQFRIVESPTEPSIPIGPNRFLFLTVVLIVGLGSGLGFALMLSFSSETYSNAGQVRQALPVPVIGAISISDLGGLAGGAGSAARSTVFWLATLGLLATFSGTILLEWGVGLDQTLFREIFSKIPAGWSRWLPTF